MMTDKLYNQIITHVYTLLRDYNSYSLQKEDLAAEVAIAFCERFSGDTECEKQVYSFINLLTFNLKNDNYRFNKVRQFPTFELDAPAIGLYGDDLDVHNLIPEPTTDHDFMEDLEKHAETHEIDWLVSYYSNPKKTAPDRLKSARMVKRIQERIEGKKNIVFNYEVKNLKTGEKNKYRYLSDFAKEQGVSPQRVEHRLRTGNGIFLKKYLITRL